VSPEVVLIIIGALLVVVSIVGSGEYVQFKVPPVPTWGRVMLGVIGCGLLVLAFTPLAASTDHSSARPTLATGAKATPSASGAASTSVPSSSPSASSSSTSAPLDLKLQCSLNTQSLRPGITVIMTYHITLNQEDAVGLGAAIYDNSGNDHSTGRGDINTIILPPGQLTKSRRVPIPSNLSSGRYEIDAEVWPPNEVGKNGVNTVTGATCAHFSVP